MENKKVLIDVRTPMEFNMGHAEGSINLPLDEVVDRIDEIKKFTAPTFVCASGARSGSVVDYLVGQGFECENGGSWVFHQGGAN